MRLLIFIFLLTFVKITAYTQSRYVSGIAVDSLTNKQIKNVTIKVFNGEKKLGEFLTDSLGLFKIPVSIYTPCSHLSIQLLGYKTIIYIKNNSIVENSSLGFFKLAPDGIDLGEVVIKKKRTRYRDTTKIDLSNKRYEREIMIDDLFSRDLGFYKDNNGLLYYKGKMVSDVVVNGGDFFGKNNTDIFKNLPALILNNIEIVVTDIDSVTNTTLRSPAIKVNLKLKEKYSKGKFGNVNLGLGTLERYMFSTDLYTYKKNEQLSLSLNSNNINVGDSFSEPRINFVGNGNNTINNSSRLSYRNLYYKNKVELSFYLKGKIDQTTIASESDRLDEAVNQFSKTSNTSKTKTYAFDGASVNINYKIDSLNFLRFSQVFDFNKIKRVDSLGYLIRAGNILNQLEVNKQRNSVIKTLDSKLSYKKMFSTKKGRSLNLIVSFKDQINEVTEDNNVFNYFNFFGKSYFVNGERQVNEKKVDFVTEYTEPFNETAYFLGMLEYKRERLLFDEDVKSDSIGNNTRAQVLNYQYFTSGIKLYKKIDKITLEGAFFLLFNSRDLGESKSKFLWNTEARINFDYKYEDNKNFNAIYTKSVNYPQSSQLIGINNSFDIIAQQHGNLKLLPEIKHKAEFIYDLKKTDSINISLDGYAELFTSKFGFIINAVPGATQIMTVGNVGNALNADLSLNLSKNLATGHNYNYRMGLNFQELPGIINDEAQLNKSLSINQTITTNLTVMKNILSNSPSLSVAYSRFSYQGSKNNQLNIVYTDRVALRVFKFQFNTYPFLNFNYSLAKNFTFALNAEIKRSFLKNYGSVWLKAYDVFNSFKYVNNINTSSYIENIKYSNVNRYFILGASLKFNNMR